MTTIRRVDIIEEVPGIDYYRWLVCLPHSPINRRFPDRDPRIRFFYDDPCPRCGDYKPRRFDTIEQAKVWCADHGLHWNPPERFEP